MDTHAAAGQPQQPKVGQVCTYSEPLASPISQAEFENVLFSIMWSKGYNQQYVDCYKMVTQFYQQRQPLVIMVCGAAWTGGWTGHGCCNRHA